MDINKIKVKYDLKGIVINKMYCSAFLLILKQANVLLALPKTNCVLDYEFSAEKKLILLKVNLNIQIFDDLKKYISAKNFTFLKFCNCVLISYVLSIPYEKLTFKQVLEHVLSEKILNLPSSFETIGHIAHFNLRDDLIPYKNFIGQIILDKNPHIKTVVNKTENIHNEYRNFEFEIMAGDINFVTRVVENGFVYWMDYSKVFWNSRLSHEHERIVEMFCPGDIIFDMFCGVGPFSIPAAAKKCKVFANDLNAISIEYLRKNIKSNKLENSAIEIYNMNARIFFSQHFLGKMIHTDLFAKKKVFVVMNLPAFSIDFLGLTQKREINFSDLFINIRGSLLSKRITVLCHCFSSGGCEFESDIINRAESVLKSKICDYRIVSIRKVSPKKEMFCLEFILN